MRRHPGVQLVAYDHPRWHRVGKWTSYALRVFRDGRWFDDISTRYFAGALNAWKEECEYRKGKA